MSAPREPSTFEGLGIALATPFAERDATGGGAGAAEPALDLDALRRLVRHAVAGGADFLVALGSTGEAALLCERERDDVLACAVAAAGNVPVVAGTGALSTAQCAAWTARARTLGAFGALVVVPPYVKPSQAGIAAHFAAVAARSPGFPLIAYNVPSRTGTNLLPATVTSLWALPEVSALKESSGDLEQIRRIAASLPAGKRLLAGDDALAAATIAAGGHGLISVAANVVPRALQVLVAAARAGRDAEAKAQHERLQPLFAALSLEPNPTPLKAALALRDLCGDAVRLPLLPAAPATRDALRAALAALPAHEHEDHRR